MGNIERGRLPEEEAFREAQKLKEEVESGESKDYNEAEKIVEKEKHEVELSPEVIEKIMEKVQDVNEEGTAYITIQKSYRAHSTDSDRIGSILQNGLLGKIKHDRNIDEIKQDWVNFMKNKRSLVRSKNREYAEFDLPIVWFNIVGQSTNRTGDTSLTNSDLLNPLEMEMGKGENAVVIFDLSKYKEVEFDSISHRNTYTNSSPEGKDGKRVYQMEGFFLSYRVPPNKFKGILIQCRRDKSEEEILGYEDDRLRELSDQDRIEHIKEKFDHDEAAWLERAESMAQKMRQTYKDKENLLVPIYDVYGNLLWPKKMSYEEVQNFVEERDGNQKTREEKE